MKRVAGLFILLLSFSLFAGTFSKVSVSERLQRSDIVVEGTIIGKATPVMNRETKGIFTPYYLVVSEKFKGSLNIGDTVEILFHGGRIRNIAFINTASVMPPVGTKIIIFLKQDNNKFFPAFLGYSMIFIDEAKGTAKDLIETHNLQTVYNKLGKSTTIRSSSVNNARLLIPSITSVSPSIVCAGCWDTLTIQGSGFGNTQGFSYVAFPNPDDGGATYVSIDSPAYYVQWTDNQIKIIVPFSIDERAGTGPVQVCVYDNNTNSYNCTNASSSTTVAAAINQYIYQGTVYDLHYYDASGSGGYALIPSSAFKSSIDRWNALKRAMSTWRCGTFVRLDTLGGTTTTNSSANDGEFVVAFNNIDGVGGTLGYAQYWYYATWNSSTSSWDWRINHFDIIIDDSENWYAGTGTPPSSQHDLESVLLHELGHTIGLGHVINTSDVMHYAIAPGTTRRTLTGDNINAVNLKLMYSTGGTHSHSVMSPVSASECNFFCDLNATYTLVEPSCNGYSDGWIKVTVQGGTGPYSHAWSPSPTGQQTAPDGSTDSIWGVSAGTWTDQITDANGCIHDLQITVYDPPQLVVSLDSVHDVSCAGYSDGAVWISVSGGTPGYSYSWSNGSTQQNISSVPAGTYSVIVTDTKGCQDTLQNINVSSPPPLSITLDSIRNALCYGDSSGYIFTTIGGGTPPYSINWSNGYTTDDITNLPADTYQIVIQDANMCKDSASYVINQPSPLNVSISWNPPANCGDSGTVSVSISGGTSPYSVSWSNGATGTNINVPAGAYTLTITDGNGCTKDTTVSLNDPNAPTVALDSIVHVKCYGDSTGAIFISVSGGTSPYSFSWSNGSSSQNLANVPAGTYTVDVIGSDGCKNSATFTVNQPPKLSVSIVYDTTNSLLYAVVTGGTPPYTITWMDSITADTVYVLYDGTYTLTVTDNNGCTQNDIITIGFTSVNITDYPDQVCKTYFAENKVNISCNTIIQEVQLYALDGKLLYASQVHNTQHSFSLKNNQQLTILKVITNNGVKSFKLLATTK